MAGVLGNYYFDGVSFANASMLYTDSALTTAAPNGYYGQSGIVRQLIGGPSNPTLLAALPCDTCTVPCGSGVSGSGGTGQYTVTMNLGNSVGAAIVSFNPASVPDKCTWTYDGVSASEYSTATEGYLQGVIGTISSGNNCSPQLTNLNGSNGQTASGASFVYDSGTNQFVNQGVPVTLGPYANQAAGGVSLTTNAPGVGVMVVPKPNTTPENVTFVIEGPCATTGWSIAVVCPALLIGFAASSVALTSTAACSLPTTGSSIFNVPVNGSAGSPGLYDWVFQDANGVTPVGVGFYSISATQFIEVDANGVIVQIGTCP